MSERSQRCKFSAHDDCAGGSCTCTCHDPNHLASIAESLEKLANPLISINPPLSESEKFFAKASELLDSIKDGRFSIEMTPAEFVKTTYTGSSGYQSKPHFRVVITPKAGE